LTPRLEKGGATGVLSMTDSSRHFMTPQQDRRFSGALTSPYQKLEPRYQRLRSH